MKITNLQCPNCMAQINIKDKSALQNGVAHCDHCGTNFVLESETIRDQEPARQSQKSTYQAKKPEYRPYTAPAKPSKKRWPALFVIAVIGFVLFIGIRSLAGFGDLVADKGRTMPESKAVQSFLEHALGKPYSKIKEKDIAAIYYLDIDSDREGSNDQWVFRYSYSDPHEGGSKFEKSIKTVCLPKELTESIEWPDMQCFVGLRYLDLNGGRYFSNPDFDYNLKMLKKLRYYEGCSSQAVSEMKKSFADPDAITGLGAALRSEDDIDALLQFKNLDSFSVLSISEDAVSSDSLAQLRKLSNLHTLRIDCHYKELNWLSALTKLKHLYLTSSNDCKDYSVLYGLPKLEGLIIENARGLKEIGFVKSMPRLASFTLDSSNVRTLKPLRNKTSLSRLTIGYNSELKDLSALSNLKNLEELQVTSLASQSNIPRKISSGRLKNVSLPGTFLPVIANKRSISSLTVYSSNEVDCSLFTEFRGMRKLTFNVEHSNISNTGQLKKLTKLKELEFKKGSFYRPELIQPIFQLKINKLSFSGTYLNFNEAGFKPSKTIKRLSLNKCYYNYWQNGETIARDDGIGRFVIVLHQMKGLKQLSLVESDLDDISFLKKFKSLSELDISYNYVTDIAPLAGLPKLQRVKLHENPVTNKSVLSEDVLVYEI